MKAIVFVWTEMSGESQSTEDEGIERDSGDADDPPSMTHVRRGADAPSSMALTTLAQVMDVSLHLPLQIIFIS